MMDAFDKVNTVEDLFKSLDEQEYSHIAKPLGALRRQLMGEGFTRRETMRLVEAYGKLMYDMILEGYVSDRRKEEIDMEDEAFFAEDKGDVDDDDPEDYAT